MRRNPKVDLFKNKRERINNIFVTQQSFSKQSRKSVNIPPHCFIHTDIIHNDDNSITKTLNAMWNNLHGVVEEQVRDP